MHVLRDCEATLELCGKLVNPDMWHKFECLGHEQWLIFNLTDPSVGLGDWHWPLVFGSFIHMLWIDRNHFLFSGKSAMPHQILPKLFAQVELLHTHLLTRSFVFIEASHPIHVRWVPPPDGTFKLNTDGSHVNGVSTCGGLVRNSLGRFIRGFHCNLGVATSVAAELWGLVLGLCLARSMGINSLVVEMDSMVVVNMVKAHGTHCMHLQPLLDEAVSLLFSLAWGCSITHVFREANSWADILVGLGHGGGFQWLLLEEAPLQLRFALASDAKGVSFVRMV